MKTAPSEVLQGVAEEIVEVDVDEYRIIGDPNAPNKDTNTVPTLCILNIGTVPTLCILYVGTVPTFRHSQLNMYKAFVILFLSNGKR